MALFEFIPHAGTGASHTGNQYYAIKVKFNKDVYFVGAKWYNDNVNTTSVNYVMNVYRASDSAFLTAGFQVSTTLAGVRRWYSDGASTPVKFLADVEYWIGFYFVDGANMTLPYLDGATGGNAIPHTHTNGSVVMTITGAGSNTANAVPNTLEPQFEYSIAPMVSDTPISLSRVSGTAIAGVFSNETWTNRLKVDKAIRVTGLSWYSPTADTGTINISPRIYRVSDKVLVGSGNSFSLTRVTPGWQPIVPLDVLQPVLDPNVDYDVGFFYPAPAYAIAKPSLPSASYPTTHTITIGGITYTFTGTGRSALSGDVAPTAMSTDAEVSYGVQLLGSGQGLQMML